MTRRQTIVAESVEAVFVDLQDFGAAWVAVYILEDAGAGVPSVQVEQEFPASAMSGVEALVLAEVLRYMEKRLEVQRTQATDAGMSARDRKPLTLLEAVRLAATYDGILSFTVNEGRGEFWGVIDQPVTRPWEGADGAWMFGYLTRGGEWSIMRLSQVATWSLKLLNESRVERQLQEDRGQARADVG